MHEVQVNRLGGLSLPRKSVVSLTDRPDMTLTVYRGRKKTIQQQQQQSSQQRQAETRQAYDLSLIFISSNYPCLEYTFMVQKLFEQLKLYCMENVSS